MARLLDIGDQRQQITRQRTGQTDTLQAPPEIGLLRLATLQLVPGQRAELYFQQFAQAVEFRAHRVEDPLIHRWSRRSRGWSGAAWLVERRLDERFGRSQRQAGKQLAVGARIAVTFAAQAQFGLGSDNTRLGLAQLILEFHVGNPWCQCRELVVQRSRQLDTARDPAVADDGCVRAQFVTNQLHGLTHIGGEKTLNLHNPLPQPLGPTVATMVTCLLSGISW